MSKLFNMFLVLVAIQVALLIYVDPSPALTAIWTFITTPSLWSTSSLLDSLLGIAFGLFLVGITAATIFGYKTDTIIFAPLVASLLSIGIVFSQLALKVNDELVSLICTPAAVSPAACTPSILLTAIFVGVPALYYVWTVIEWWRNPATP